LTSDSSTSDSSHVSENSRPKRSSRYRRSHPRRSRRRSNHSVSSDDDSFNSDRHHRSPSPQEPKRHKSKKSHSVSPTITLFICTATHAAHIRHSYAPILKLRLLRPLIYYRYRPLTPVSYRLRYHPARIPPNITGLQPSDSRRNHTPRPRSEINGQSGSCCFHQYICA
jgi:hypothetical protein